MKPHLLALTAVLVCTGCVHTALARRLVRAPNQQARSPITERALQDTYTAVAVPLPAPGGTLQLAVIEPGDWHLVYAATAEKTKHQYVLSAEMNFDRPASFLAEPKGTVILLHGFAQRKELMLHWGLSLAQEGYRCVLVDLRGHGGSSGDWVGFGAFEVQDLRAMLDTLIARKLVAGKLGVLGISLGASLGLQWAGSDPRIATVVAVEPFADPRAAMDSMVHNFPPFRRMLWWVPEGTLQRAIREAPEQAGFHWAEIKVPEAVQHNHGPILFLHGAEDTLVPPEHSRRLSAVAPPGSRLLILPGEDHLTLALRLDPYAKVIQAWFQQHLVD